MVPFFANIPLRTGWRGEMRYGLLNDARVLDKDAWPLMVERYVALAYDNGVMRCAKTFHSRCWAAPAGQRRRKSQACNAFNLSNDRPIIGFCPGAEFGPARRWPHYHYAALAKKLIDDGYQIALFGSAKITMPAKRSSPRSAASSRRWCRNLAGETQLEQAVILIAACQAVVSNDSGLMHVAAARRPSAGGAVRPEQPGLYPAAVA